VDDWNSANTGWFPKKGIKNAFENIENKQYSIYIILKPLLMGVFCV
jgi:hypothetical protein